MLLEMEEVGEIKARGTLRQKTKYDSNSLINPDLNEEVTMSLFVRSESKDLHCRARLGQTSRVFSI